MHKCLSLLCLAGLLAACPVAQPTKCEFDGGAAIVVDAGAPEDAGPPGTDLLARFVNVTSAPVLLTMTGDDAGTWLPVGGSVQRRAGKTKFKNIVMRLEATVEGEQQFADGGTARDAHRVQVTQADLDCEGCVLTDAQAVDVVIHRVSNSMPNRISMNVTVPKQTQGATFGERVAKANGASLVGGALPGGAVISAALRGIDTTGDCLADYGANVGRRADLHLLPNTNTPDITCDELDTFLEPASMEASGALPFVTTDEAGENVVAWVAPTRTADGVVTSPSVAFTRRAADIYVLNADPSRNTLQLKSGALVLVDAVAPGQLAKIDGKKQKQWLPANFRTTAPSPLTLQVSGGGMATEIIWNEGAANGVVTGPCRPPYLCDFIQGDSLLVLGDSTLSPAANVLKTKHDTVKNSIGNVRRELAAVTTMDPRKPVTLCFFSSAQDDTCVMGASVPINAAVSAVSALAGGPGGGAAAASYARLAPPHRSVGLPFKFAVDEYDLMGVKQGRFLFTWGDNAMLPTEGFIVLVDGPVAAPGALGRALLAVDTSARPWRVSMPISSIVR